MASTYILYSQSADRFYTGSCLNFEKRLSEHSSGKYGNTYTAIANDWITYLVINDLDYHQARSIERHIKKMKSKKYIQNLIIYPEIIEKLKEQFKAGSSR